MTKSSHDGLLLKIKAKLLQIYNHPKEKDIKPTLSYMHEKLDYESDNISLRIGQKIKNKNIKKNSWNKFMLLSLVISFGFIGTKQLMKEKISIP